MSIAWPQGLPTFYQRLRANSGVVLHGTLVTLDPSIGSRDSQTGYAMFYQGRMQLSGRVFVDPKADVYKRTRILYETLATLLPSPPDVLGIEGLPTSFANVKTIWAAALAIAATDAVVTIELPIPFWKAYAKAKAGYVKGDEADAIVMGEAMIAYLREVAHVTAA